MMKTREVEIKVGGRIIGITEMGDGTYRFVVETLEAVQESEIVEATNMVEGVKKPCEDVFVLVEASKLSLSDSFMQYEPQTPSKKKFKELLTDAIKEGLKDFYRPKYDPSFNEEGTGIAFEAGKKPAVGKSYNWWAGVAKEFMPTRGSRLGTKSEYVAFLGVLIKKLVETGWSAQKAWNAVCNNSKELGHYRNSKNAKHDFEDTGSREVCGFYDLANTCKILAEDVDIGGFWVAGGFSMHRGDRYRLADLNSGVRREYNFGTRVGWLVLSK